MSLHCTFLAFLIFCHVSVRYGLNVDGDEDRSARIQEEANDIEADLERQLEDSGLSGRAFTNEWAVKVDGGSEVADAVARDLGYINTGQIGALSDYYLLERSNHPKRSKRAASHHTRSLHEDTRVAWVEQQFEKIRVKRDNVVDKRQEARAYRNARYDDNYWQRQWYLKHRKKRAPVYNTYENDAYKDTHMDDPLYKDQWYLLPESFDHGNDKSPKMDLGVIPTWFMNITGRGVNVVVIDDGLDYTHPDLEANYCPECSYDFNSNDNDPMPRLDNLNTNKKIPDRRQGTQQHGTRCAGEISMIANNGICGVGVAYNAGIGGIRMLDGKVTDSLEANALTYAINKTSVFSCSWGPSDKGKVVEGPGKLASAAFVEGVTSGRQGLGVLYSWASGNGGENDDNCICDGYAGSIYTISISSASQNRMPPWYSESCASTIGTTYSSGDYKEKKVVSTDLHNKCTQDHTGTSASAPLAAGIFALMLEANPTLTWRDVQHLIAWTAIYEPLSSTYGWKVNAGGFRVNSHFGFGLLNGFAIVNAADKNKFKTVAPQRICKVDTKEEEHPGVPVELRSGQQVTFKLTTSGCKEQKNAVSYLEHVQIVLDMSYSKRGVLEMWLISPSGTNTSILTPREHDHSTEGFKDWAFMSVHTWGESPFGEWLFGIRDSSKHGNKGKVTRVQLVMHGINEVPFHVQQAGGKRVYTSEFIDVKHPMSMVPHNLTDIPLRHYNKVHVPLELAPIQPKTAESNSPFSTKDHVTTLHAGTEAPNSLRDKFQASIDELRNYIEPAANDLGRLENAQLKHSVKTGNVQNSDTFDYDFQTPVGSRNSLSQNIEDDNLNEDLYDIIFDHQNSQIDSSPNADDRTDQNWLTFDEQREGDPDKIRHIDFNLKDILRASHNTPSERRWNAYVPSDIYGLNPYDSPSQS